jgi:hypothetical protein
MAIGLVAIVSYFIDDYWYLLYWCLYILLMAIGLVAIVSYFIDNY